MGLRESHGAEAASPSMAYTQFELCSEMVLVYGLCCEVHPWAYRQGSVRGWGTLR